MRPCDSALELLDDVAGWMAQDFDRAHAAQAERRQLDAALAGRVERIEARLAAGGTAGQSLPWDRLRGALWLSPSEQGALLAIRRPTTQRSLARRSSSPSASSSCPMLLAARLRSVSKSTVWTSSISST
jgi:hypothetical protein